MPSLLLLVGGLSLLAWLYLVFFHGGFWRCSERLAREPICEPMRWPAVAAVVPARNEAETVAAALESLLTQHYPGPLSVTLVDDCSSDRTASLAAETAARHSGRVRLAILPGGPLPFGWVGKPWALKQGIDHALRLMPETEFILMSDADIVHAPATLRQLVSKADNEERDLVSLMARLNCETAWERLLIPAFIFFFQKLYPFPLANDDASPTAAAAGGCALIRRRMLDQIGGMEAVRGALIDDCALAEAVKATGGRQWIGLADATHSLRLYRDLRPIWTMVARSAFTQLRHSSVLLLGTVLGMALLYLAPPLLLVTLPLHGDALAAGLGALAWLLMTAAYLPTIRYHRQHWLLALLLPLAALLYVAMTIDSARRHWLGRGNRWKGRDYGAGDHLAGG